MATFSSTAGYTLAYIDNNTIRYKNVDYLEGKIHHVDHEFIFYINEDKLFAHHLLIDKNDLYVDATYISGSFDSTIIIVCIQEKIYYMELGALTAKSKLKFLCDKQDNFVCRHALSCIVFNGEYLYQLFISRLSVNVYKYPIKDLTFLCNEIFNAKNKIYSDKNKIRFLQSDEEIIVDRTTTWVKLNKYIHLSTPSACAIESNGKNILMRDKSVIVTERCVTIPVPQDAELYYHQQKAVKSARNV
jgi:hypothetical protein